MQRGWVRCNSCNLVTYLTKLWPKPTSKAEYFVGVDLGGTKILAGVFKNSLECIGTAKLSTKSQRGVEAVIERIARCVQDAVDEADLTLKQVAGVGIGAPGAVDFAEGRVIFAPNLEGWKDVPLKKDLEKHLGVPVFVENDCNICRPGRPRRRTQRPSPSSLIGIFVGTGIGGGLIINGELYSGFNHTAGEIGHMVLDVNGPKCGCGNKGCFEALASRTAIFQQIKAGVKDGQKTLLTEMLGDDLSDLRSGDLRKAIRRGDKFVDKRRRKRRRIHRHRRRQPGEHPQPGSRRRLAAASSRRWPTR